MNAPAALDLNEKATWMYRARSVIEHLARGSQTQGTTFTADELRAEFVLIGEPADPNWIGTAFSAARTAGIIERAGFTVSRTKSRHGGVVRVWRAA